MLCKLLLLSALNLSTTKGVCELKKKDPSWAEKSINTFEIFSCIRFLCQTHKNYFRFKAISWHDMFFNSSSCWKHLTDEWLWLCVSCIFCIDVLLLMWVQDMVNLWCCDCVYLHCTALERVFFKPSCSRALLRNPNCTLVYVDTADWS